MDAVPPGREPAAAPCGEPFPVPTIGLMGGGALTPRILDAAPGPYRFAKRIQAARATRWLVASHRAARGRGPVKHGEPDRIMVATEQNFHSGGRRSG